MVGKKQRKKSRLGNQSNARACPQSPTFFQLDPTSQNFHKLPK
jgi:hypothetical protein